jgi:hypothetical protein
MFLLLLLCKTLSPAEYPSDTLHDAHPF